MENFKKHGKRPTLLTHGVDVDLFTNPHIEEHALLGAIPKPRVGYFGLFDDRSDQDLLHNLALLKPDVSFVITGGIETDISRLQDLKNVYFTGSIPYVEVPAMAKGYDICMLPYKLNKLTDAIQPLKFKEYFATGKPVISTPINEARNLADYVDVASSAEEWATTIQSYLDGESPRNQENRQLFLQGESWKEKSEQFLNLCLR
jgi:glycosyltransferase involved in cell wall biosynthesis